MNAKVCTGTSVRVYPGFVSFTSPESFGFLAGQRYRGTGRGGWCKAAADRALAKSQMPTLRLVSTLQRAFLQGFASVSGLKDGVFQNDQAGRKPPLPIPSPCCREHESRSSHVGMPVSRLTGSLCLASVAPLGPVIGRSISPILAPDTMKLAESHGVRNPQVPGGVFLSGTLSKEAVAEISPLCKSWLFLNPETDVNLHREAIEAGGAKLQAILCWTQH